MNSALTCNVRMEITGSNSVEESWKLDNVLEQRLREVNHDSVKTNLQVRNCVCVHVTRWE